LQSEDLVVLWTGFTQQTGEMDLQFAIRTARIALAGHPRGLAFNFSFKPEHFKESYQHLERPGIRVLHTAETFDSARKAADLLLSPVVDRRSTAAPPLVWLECLAMGVPILTTDIPGAEEAVEDHRSGFLVPSPEGGAERLSEMKGDPNLRRRLRDGARDIAVERYSVEKSLQEYVDLWSGLERS
jgi:glycosyltransferase involved in cell wall biosynthesis